MEVVLPVKTVCIAAGWTRLCNNRWIMQEAACRPLWFNFDSLLCQHAKTIWKKNQSQTCSDIWFHCLLICKFLLDNLKVFVMSLRLFSHWEQERRVSSAEAMVLAQSLFLLHPSCSISDNTFHGQNKYGFKQKVLKLHRISFNKNCMSEKKM